MQLTEEDILLTLAQIPRADLYELSNSIKPDPEYIIDTLKLGKLNEECLTALKNKIIHVTAAYCLTKLTHAEQTLAFHSAKCMSPSEFTSLVTLYLANKKADAKKRR